MELLEKILDDKNLYHAYKQVYKNKGASGVDGITVEELGVYLFQHKEEIKEQISGFNGIAMESWYKKRIIRSELFLFI